MLNSKLLRREIPYRVILPSDYPNSQKKLPVLYLLHGLFGNCDNWLELTKITEYLKHFEIITVLIEGKNSWYSDSVIIENNRFESYIVDDLIPEIELKFEVLSQREKRAIAGLSMGGYGAVKFGLKRPDLFGFAGSMSGAFDAPNHLTEQDEFDADELNSTILEVFGAGRTAIKIENDIFQIVKNYPADNISSLPYLYLDCGEQDGFLSTNIEFHNLLNDRGILHDFVINPGGHDWNYWDKQIAEILKITNNFFT